MKIKNRFGSGCARAVTDIQNRLKNHQSILIVGAAVIGGLYTLLGCVLLFGINGNLFQSGILSASTAVLTGAATWGFQHRKKSKGAGERKNISLEGIDILTGLLNIQGLKQRFAEMLTLGETAKLAVIGVDSLEAVNGIFGYRAGNLLLGDIAAELKSCIEDDEAVGRWRDGRFILLLHTANHEETEQRLNTFLDNLRKVKVVIGPQICDYQCRYSCGVTESAGELNLDELCDEANLARRKGKKASEATVCQFYEREMEGDLREKIQLKADLQQALQNREFHPWIIPQYDLDNGEIFGGEVQIRWKHSTRGWIREKELQVVIEEEKCAGALEIIVIEKVCREIKRFLDSGLMPVPIFVKISANSMYWSGFADRVIQIAKKYEVPPSLLYLDLPGQHIAKDLAHVVRFAGSLDDAGIKISINDWESCGLILSTLWNIPVSALKFNLRNLQNLQWRSEKTDDQRRALIMKGVGMSERLNLRVICTMVETERQRGLLKKWGCHAASGDFLSEPVDLKEFENMLFPWRIQDEPEAQPEIEPEAQPEIEPETEPEAQPEARLETEPETQSEARPEAQLETEPETQSEARPEANRK